MSTDAANRNAAFKEGWLKGCGSAVHWAVAEAGAATPLSSYRYIAVPRPRAAAAGAEDP